MSHKYSVGEKIKHSENQIEGEIVGLTYLGLVVDDFNKQDPEFFEPWYIILWPDQPDFIDIGQEAEDSIVPIS